MHFITHLLIYGHYQLLNVTWNTREIDVTLTYHTVSLWTALEKRFSQFLGGRDSVLVHVKSWLVFEVTLKTCRYTIGTSFSLLDVNRELISDMLFSNTRKIAPITYFQILFSLSIDTYREVSSVVVLVSECFPTTWNKDFPFVNNIMSSEWFEVIAAHDLLFDVFPR